MRISISAESAFLIISRRCILTKHNKSLKNEFFNRKTLRDSLHNKDTKSMNL